MSLSTLPNKVDTECEEDDLTIMNDRECYELSGKLFLES
jgi:hypothetical protein